MADTKISQLPAAAALAGTEELPAVQAGATKKVTVGQVGAAIVMRGALAARPAPGISGRIYNVTDDDGGTAFYDTGASWVQVAPGITEAPAPHGFATHGPNGSDTWAKFARATVDESVTSSIVLQDDNELFFGVAANEVWKFWADIHYEAVSGGGITMGWTVPVGASGRWASHSLNLTATTNTDTLIVKSAAAITDSLSAGGAGGADLVSLVSGLLVCGANGGTLRLQFCQRTSSATPTIRFAHSTLCAMRVA